MTNTEISEWIDNDFGLLSWWRSSRQSKTAFIKENRAVIVAGIKNYLSKSTPEKTWRDYASNHGGQ